MVNHGGDNGARGVETLVTRETSRGGGYVLVIPRRFSFRDRHDVLRGVNTRGVLGMSVLDFAHLTFIVGRRCNGTLGGAVSSNAHGILVDLSLRTLSKGLRCFGEFSSGPTLLSGLLAFIARLGRYTMAPSRVTRVSNGAKGGSLNGGLSRLSLVTTSCSTLIDHDFFSSRGLLAVTTSVVSRASFFSKGAICFSTFYNFAGRRQGYVGDVLPGTRGIFVSLYASQSLSHRNISIFRGMGARFSRLGRYTTRRGINISSPRVLGIGRSNEDPRLICLRGCLYNRRSRPCGRRYSGVIIYTTKGETSRTSFITYRVGGLLEYGPALQYHGVTIVRHATKACSGRLSRDFGGCNIPVFRSGHQPVNVRPMVMFIGYLLTLYTRNFSARDFVELLGANLATLSNSRVSRLRGCTFL